MGASSPVGGCLALAILFAGVVSVATGSVAVLGATPVGTAIYLAVGIGLPQYLRYRERGSSLELGLAALAAASAAIVVLVGLGRGGLHNDWSAWLGPLLLIVVFGVLLGSAVREFRVGYRSQF